MLVSEWESEDALDERYRSGAFADFQFGIDRLLARPRKLTIDSAQEVFDL